MATGKKRKINVLANIENYYGAHQGRLAPVLAYMGVLAVPLLIYGTFLIPVIPFGWFLAFEVLFALRMALLLPGHEKKRLAIYKQQLADEYQSAYDLVRITQVHDDGLIEYVNGQVAYIISGFVKSFYQDSDFTDAMERFLHALFPYVYDIRCHLITSEYELQRNLEGMKVYSDSEVREERMRFYIAQDEYCEKQSKLYRYNFVVWGSKPSWKKLKMAVRAAAAGDAAKVFHTCFVCDRTEVNSVIARDLCAYIDVEQLLVGKYSSAEFYGSKVLYYGDEVPAKYRSRKAPVNLESRRVVQEER